MTPESTKHVKRGIGFFLISIFTGLAVYQTPPMSWSELGIWLWQPSIQGILAALTSLGLNQVTERNGKK